MIQILSSRAPGLCSRNIKGSYCLAWKCCASLGPAAGRGRLAAGDADVGVGGRSCRHLRKKPEDIKPQARLFEASALDKVDAVVGDDGDRVVVAGDGVGLGDLVDGVEVDDGLGDRLRVVVDAVSHLAVIVKDEPATLPPLGPAIENSLT